MKKSLLYIALMMCGAAGFTSCSGDLEQPPMIEPEATMKPNTTIADLKAMVWQTDRNYVTEVGQVGGEDVIIAGRVVSSDAAGNVFKNIVLQDKTGALTVAINSYDLYQTYQQGQQVVVNMTGLKIGGYNGLLQVGAEGSYNNAPSMTFMEKELFAEHAQQNGLSRLNLIDTLTTTIPDVVAAKGSVEGLQKWQSQLIRLDGVSFEDAGQPFAGTSTTNRYIKDAAGNRINVRNSSYADFAKAILPEGTGSVVGILSYYGTDWQILLNDLDGCIGFGDITTPDNPDNPDNPDTPDLPAGDGSADNPYNVMQVVKGATGTGVWVKGYIVGSYYTDDSVTPSVNTAVFGTEPASTTNILIAATADETSLSNCVPVQLPAGDIRTKVNLSANPGNYKAEIKIQGNLEKYFQMPGIKTPTAFSITGGSEVTPPVEPAGVIYSALDEASAELTTGWTIENVNLGSLDYVWSWKVYNSKGYLNGSGYKGSAQAAEAYAVSPEIDLTGATAPSLSFDHAAKFQTTLKELCGVYAREAGTTAWTQLTIPTWPEAGAWTFANSGNVDLAAFAGKKIQVAFKYGSTESGADTWEVKNLKVVSAGDSKAAPRHNARGTF